MYFIEVRVNKSELNKEVTKLIKITALKIFSKDIFKFNSMIGY